MNQATATVPIEDLIGQGPDDPRPLHIVHRLEYPIAMCGARVVEPFDPHRTDTRGRDRCTQCLAVLAERRKSRG